MMLQKLLKEQCVFPIIFITVRVTFDPIVKNHTSTTHYYFRFADLVFLRVCFLGLFLVELPLL